MFETVALNLGYVLLVSAAFARTLGKLRALLVAAAVALAIYGAIIGVISMVVWNLAVGAIHAFRLFRDIIASRGIILTDEECKIRDEYFVGSSDFDFNALWGMGRTVHHQPGALLIKADSHPESVSMVLDGGAAVQDRRKVVLTRLGRGDLVGEMSYVSGEKASVDVVAVDTVTTREWDQRHLRTLGQTNPPSAKALDNLISKDLAAKARS